jgi:hypothetical protein
LVAVDDDGAVGMDKVLVDNVSDERLLHEEDVDVVDGAFGVVAARGSLIVGVVVSASKLNCSSAR